MNKQVHVRSKYPMQIFLMYWCQLIYEATLKFEHDVMWMCIDAEDCNVVKTLLKCAGALLDTSSWVFVCVFYIGNFLLTWYCDALHKTLATISASATRIVRGNSSQAYDASLIFPSCKCPGNWSIEVAWMQVSHPLRVHHYQWGSHAEFAGVSQGP